MKFKYTFVLFILALFSCHQAQNLKKYRIGFSQCTGGDAWRQQMLMSMQGELAFHPEMELIYKDAENNTKRQIDDIETFINEKVDLLIVSPNEADPITPAVEKAFRNGIPVIIVDRKTSSDKYSAYIGANNYAIGKLAGAYIAELLNGKGTFLEIWGLRGSSPAIDRHRGLSEALSKYPGIVQVKEINGKWEMDTAQVNLRRVINELPKVDLVFAHNDVMAYGAHSVYAQVHPDNDIRFIGIDALPGPSAGIEFVDEGILTASFLYPTGGEESIRIAKKILTGQAYEKENLLHSTVVDASNVTVMKLQSDKLLSQQRDIVRQQQKINEQIQTYYSQRILIYVLLTSLVAVIVVGAIAALSWREKNEMNKRLQTKTREILEQKNTIAQMAEQAEIATQEKLRFFTNISHEFKTPLTLILGPIEELLTSGVRNNDFVKDNLLLIKRNATRLLRLVNQLMDFRKIEDRKMLLKASEADIIAFIADVMSAFSKVAQKRKIDFRMNCDLKQLYVWFDLDMLDKVIFNLLSNAFKFTNDGGRIHVHVSAVEAHRHASIVIEDNGVGMSEEHVRHAFDRFHTGDNSGGGTGIGLSLSKEFLELHHGELILTSEKGRGTRFSISLPLGNKHFQEHELLPATTDRKQKIEVDLLEVADISEPSDSTQEEDLTKDHTLLIIEDNTELRQFLKRRLEGEYSVEEAQDGISGLHLALETVPDLIICDVMLPGKDGFAISRTLKEDLRTSHIPIILLTAKGSIEQKIAGIQSGADEYISKPFVFEYLSEKIRSLIKNREFLKEHYSHDIASAATASGFHGSLDKKFVNDFVSLVEKNLANPEFNVNDIGRELGMSRVQVYRKVKALLGYSVIDYIVNVRLKKAKYLLSNTDHAVADIADQVGFTSATYFSRAFKAKFRVTPKEFRVQAAAV